MIKFFMLLQNELLNELLNITYFQFLHRRIGIFSKCNLKIAFEFANFKWFKKILFKQDFFYLSVSSRTDDYERLIRLHFKLYKLAGLGFRIIFHNVIKTSSIKNYSNINKI